jgi:hypothetical protein
MNFAKKHDTNNEWFCFITDTCIPIIDPFKFRFLFFENYTKDIIKYKKADWDINFHKRANLHCLPSKYHLKNDAWFVLSKSSVSKCIEFITNHKQLYITISNGIIANESIFAIILLTYNTLKTNKTINMTSTLCDWSRMKNQTSPHTFLELNDIDKQFLDYHIYKEPYVFFLRKIHKNCPEEYFKELIKKNNIYSQSFKNTHLYISLFSKLGHCGYYLILVLYMKLLWKYYLIKNLLV